MSYDIELRDRVSGQTIQLPVLHTMHGGMFPADYDPATGTFTPKPISDAHLNITYNYGHYYYEVTDGDPRFAHDEVSAYYANGTTGPIKTEYGIRGIYGKTGLESIPLLEDMIRRIEEKYKSNGEWIETNRHRVKYIDNLTGKELHVIDTIGRDDSTYHKVEFDEMISEGPNSDYWEDTAANAIRPLYQLIAMAKMRPDGVWAGD